MTNASLTSLPGAPPPSPSGFFLVQPAPIIAITPASKQGRKLRCARARVLFFTRFLLDQTGRRLSSLYCVGFGVFCLVLWRSARDHVEIDLLRVRRAPAYHDFEAAGLDHPLHPLVEERQLVGADGELDLLRFACLKVDSPEPFQLRNRTGHRADHVVDVELHHLVGGGLAAVGHDHGGGPPCRRARCAPASPPACRT